MGEAGLFRGERVELIKGEVVAMSPHDPLHAGAVENASTVLNRLLGSAYVVRVQLPMVAPDDSEPEPDLLLLTHEQARQFRRERRHPDGAALVVEVSRTSLDYDRLEKSSLYAETGVGEFWIINLVDMVVETSRQPARDPAARLGWCYRETAVLGPDEVLSFDGGSIPVGALFADLNA